MHGSVQPLSRRSSYNNSYSSPHSLSSSQSPFTPPVPHPAPPTSQPESNSFLSFFETKSKRLAFFVSCWAVLVSGILYGYGALSPTLATLLRRSSVDLVGSFGDLGQYVALTQGYLYDTVSLRTALLVNAMLSFLGYLIIYIVVHGMYTSELALLCFGFLLLGQGNHGTQFCLIAVNSRNYPEQQRGFTVGFMQSCYAFSPIVFVPILIHVLQGNLSDFFLMMLIVTLFFQLLATLVVRQLRDNPNTETDIEQESLIVRHVDAFQFMRTEPEHLSFSEAVRTSEFWMLFSIFFIVGGCGLMFKNTIGTVVHDLGIGYSNLEELILIWAGLNAVSTSVSGFLSDYFDYSIPRVLWIMLSALIMSIGHVFYVAFGQAVLVETTLMTAVGLGFCCSLVGSISGLMFGMKSFGLIYGSLYMAMAAGGFVFTAIFVAMREERKQSIGNCKTFECFQNQFLVSSVCLGIAAVVAYMLSRSKLSRKMHERLRGAHTSI